MIVDILFLEQTLNKKIEKLKGHYGQSSFERSCLIKDIWCSFFSEIDSSLIQDSILWAGFCEDSFSVKLELINDPKEGSILHQLHKTDSNCYIGYVKHNQSLNSFERSKSIHFFIDSWYGSMSGTFSPFVVSLNSFYATQKVS